MPKNIILCCDGTSNEFGSTNTNVVRLFQSLDFSSAGGQLSSDGQLGFYDPGVGTLAPPGVFTRIGRAVSLGIGLAFGAGLLENVQNAVGFLMRCYEPGDRVYIFGFSRGAYTARAIAGALHKCGLPRVGSDNLLPYFIRTYRNTTDWNVSRDFKRTFGRACPVHFLGLWDTVSTLGWVCNPQHLPYTRSNPEVAVVRHAISLDERRCFFRTNRWGTPDPASAADAQREHHPAQDVCEIWFPGVHCDVGGGYPLKQTDLWKLSFEWMVREAGAAGLKFDSRRVDEFLAPNPPPAGQEWARSPQSTSLTGLWWAFELLPKKYYDFRSQPPRYRFRIPLGGRREVPAGALLHRSIVDRIRALSAYRPQNLSAAFVQKVLADSSTNELVTYQP